MVFDRHSIEEAIVLLTRAMHLIAQLIAAFNFCRCEQLLPTQVLAFRVTPCEMTPQIFLCARCSRIKCALNKSRHEPLPGVLRVLSFCSRDYRNCAAMNETAKHNNWENWDTILYTAKFHNTQRKTRRWLQAKNNELFCTQMCNSLGKIRNKIACSRVKTKIDHPPVVFVKYWFLTALCVKFC